MKLLLVDDVPETLETLSLQYGLFPGIENIWHAKTGSEAWQVLREHEIDIVSLDIHVGAENGLSLCEHIHAELPNLFIVMCSMDSGEMERRIASVSGASYFLEKPVSYEDIRGMLGAYSKQHLTTGTDSKELLDSIAELVEATLLKGTD